MLGIQQRPLVIMHKQVFLAPFSNRKLCHSQGLHPHSGSITNTYKAAQKAVLAFLPHIAITRSFRGSSCNAIISPCNINSCLCSNSYNYSSSASTIVISTHTPQYYVTKELATSSQFLSVNDKTSDILSYPTKQLQGNFRKLKTHFRNLSIFCKCLNTPEVDLYYVLYSTMITGFSDHCTVEYIQSEELQCNARLPGF